MKFRQTISLVSAVALALAGCGGGGNSTSPVVTPPPPPPPPSTVFTVPAQESLSVADVQQIIAQSVAEAQARSKPASIAVTDRVGNVLAVFVMNGANVTLRVPDANGGAAFNKGLQGLNLPADLGPTFANTPPAVAGAIAKAVTGAYLSSGGNAFSTRTASQIVQQHFPPSPNAVGALRRAAGPGL
jgi:uncharacterized protein GlcG (DUF336 family)